MAYVPDLMDRSKVAAAAPDAVFVTGPEALVGTAAEVGATRVILDLGRRGVLDALAGLVSAGNDVVGFASHVDRELLDRARALGCQRVMARSAFFSHLTEAVAD